jgi:predicted phosphodiesterase
MYGKIFIVGDTHGSRIQFPSEENDILIHVGDYEMGKIETKAKRILIYGNHDQLPVDKEFDFACDGLLLNHVWFTHEPAFTMPLGAYWNVCGHVHDNDMNDLGYVNKPWHVVVVPNEIKTLDRLLFEAKERNENNKKTT